MAREGGGMSSASSRTTRSYPHHMPPERRVAARGSEGQTESLLLSAAVQLQRTTTFPYTCYGALSRHYPKDDVAAACSAGMRATTASFISQSLQAEAATGWQIDAGILHAPGRWSPTEPQVNFGCIRDVSMMVKAATCRGILLVKDVPPITITILTTSEHARLGEKR